MAELEPAVRHHAELDRRLVRIAKDLRILSALSWPNAVRVAFLERWRRRRPHLPEVVYPRVDGRALRTDLEAIIAACDRDHPLGRYVRGVAESFRIASLLLEHAGQSEMTQWSIALYGRPGDPIVGSEVDNLHAARHFIQAAEEILADHPLADAEPSLSPEAMRAELQAEVDRFFHRHRVKVVIDPELVAKAAAGAQRIRLRADTDFSEYDRLQLLEHEAFVHTLTGINGREQPCFPSLGMNSPRSTATQEGLAVFAEWVTGSIDVHRMQRISQRIIGIDLALKGADFIDVFRFFLDCGQSESDAFNSAMRVFRGAPLGGGSAFTKDTVYLHGLLAVHTFFRWAFKQQKLSACRRLFAGKLSLHDVLDLEPYFDSGAIAEPIYVPLWAKRVHALAAYLSFSLFSQRIQLDAIEREHLRLGL